MKPNRGGGDEGPQQRCHSLSEIQVQTLQQYHTKKGKKQKGKREKGIERERGRETDKDKRGQKGKREKRKKGRERERETEREREREREKERAQKRREREREREKEKERERENWLKLVVMSPEVAQDGLHHPEVLKLAAIGAHGAYPNHCSRDLVRTLAPSFAELPQVSVVKVPVQGHRTTEPLVFDLEVQFPHDVFAWYARKPLLFHQVFGTEEEVLTFWKEKDRRDPAFQNHPALRKHGFERRCVPLKLTPMPL